MHILRRVAALAATFSLVLPGADWPTQGGGPQREAWARAERIITKDNVGSLELLYKYRSDNEAKGLNSLTTPIIAGNLITYRGFKEMLVFTGSGDNVYSVDADLNRLLWKRHFDVKGSGAGTAGCPAGLTAPVAMSGSSSAAFRPRPPRPAASQADKSNRGKTSKKVKADAAKEAKAKLASGFGRLGGMFTVSSDGYLHTLNSSTGEDLLPPVRFVPAHSNVSSLNVMNDVIYASTANRCGGKPNALYALDVTSAKRNVAKFVVPGGEISGVDGTAIGEDGTVYVQVSRSSAGGRGQQSDSVLALTPGLTVKDYFTLPAVSNAAATKVGVGITPLVITWKDKELVIAGGRDGRVYLLDATSLGGTDHEHPLFRTETITKPGSELHGAFASWYEADSQTRWIYAPFSGSVDPAERFAADKKAPGEYAGMVALQLSDVNGQPSLKSVWAKGGMTAPTAPAIANGIVYVVAAGDNVNPAVLYALDGLSGKELYTTGKMAETFSYPGGVAIANGRAYFTTHDNTVYCLGFSKLNPQLTDR